MKEGEVFGTSANLFAEALLERGFYPENVPPVFRVENLHEAALPYLTASTYTLGKEPTEPSFYSALKRGGSRRVFSLPNPTFYIDSVVFINNHRAQLFEHFQKTDDSFSVPIYSETGRAAKIKSHSEFHRARRRHLAASRYIVKTDISRYFHSIYTHSIPWALHGKSAAKSDRKPESSAMFGNRLDFILRQSQDGQTIGIPVGPDVSYYISEIVGKAIDHRFRQAMGDDCVYLRLVDDIYIGVDEIDLADDFLFGIRDAIRFFQLDINDGKTIVLDASADLDPFWPVRLRKEITAFSDLKPTGDGGQVGRDLLYLLDEIFRTAKSESDDGIIRYAIRQIDEAGLWNSYWGYLEPFLFRAAVSYPRSWDYVARVVSWRLRKKHAVSSGAWVKVLGKTLSMASKRGADSELCWALWLSKEMSSTVPENALDAIIENCSAMTTLLAVDVHQSINHSYPLPKTKLLNRIGEKPMLGQDWLLAYELDRQFGFNIKTRNLQGNKLFGELYANNVAFYDRDALPDFIKEGEDDEDYSSALEGVIGSYTDEGDSFEDEEIDLEILLAGNAGDKSIPDLNDGKLDEF